MGDARKEAELDWKQAKVLPAREALSLISSRLPESDEEASGRGEESVASEERSDQIQRTDTASTGT